MLTVIGMVVRRLISGTIPAGSSPGNVTKTCLMARP